MKFFASALVALSSVSFANAGDPCVPEGLLTELTFKDANLAINKLHECWGKTRINNVGKYKNKQIDMVITALSGYGDYAKKEYCKIKDVWADRGIEAPATNGLRDNFGVINLQTVEYKPNSGKGNFKFCLVTETDDPVTLPAHTFSIYDLDGRAGGIAEEMLIGMGKHSVNPGLVGFQLSDPTEIVMDCEKPGAKKTKSGTCKEGRTVFKSSVNGKGSDNPRDPDNLTPLQLARSVQLVFEDTNCWELTYNHKCTVTENQETCNQAGNFLFAGHSESITEDEPCQPVGSPTLPPTRSPTKSPTKPPTKPPTREPTKSPTKPPTKPPTREPTGDPTKSPTKPPTKSPTREPTGDPTKSPTKPPTREPTVEPVDAPTEPPTREPTVDPTVDPTKSPTKPPTREPTVDPTKSPTESPVESPTSKPTDSPTKSPTESPVEPPTSEPTEAPTRGDDPLPPTCPADIELLSTVGVTEIDIGASVEIVNRAQDESKVTVLLTNTWGDNLDIYYQYKPDYLNEKCYEADDSNINEVYTKITLQCYHMKPFTELEICVTDDCTAHLSEDDNATVPQCCELDDNYQQAVCYKLIIWCTDQCPTTERRALQALRGKA